jgi:hypothetical protein
MYVHVSPNLVPYTPSASNSCLSQTSRSPNLLPIKTNFPPFGRVSVSSSILVLVRAVLPFNRVSSKISRTPCRTCTSETVPLAPISSPCEAGPNEKIPFDLKISNPSVDSTSSALSTISVGLARGGSPGNFESQWMDWRKDSSLSSADWGRRSGSWMTSEVIPSRCLDSVLWS